MSAFSRILLTPEFVASVIEKRADGYYWRERTDNYFAHSPVRGGRTLEQERDKWNRNFARRKLAIKTMLSGYHAVRILSHLVLLHRLEWVLHYGEWPKGEINHLDGDKTNNRIKNMRDCTKSENMRNQKLRRDSTSGVPGVHWDKARGQWAARIGLNGKWHGIGRFDRKADAIAARKAAEKRHGFSPRHGAAA